MRNMNREFNQVSRQDWNLARSRDVSFTVTKVCVNLRPRCPLLRLMLITKNKRRLGAHDIGRMNPLPVSCWVRFDVTMNRDRPQHLLVVTVLLVVNYPVLRVGLLLSGQVTVSCHRNLRLQSTFNKSFTAAKRTSRVLYPVHFTSIPWIYDYRVLLINHFIEE